MKEYIYRAESGSKIPGTVPSVATDHRNGSQGSTMNNGEDDAIQDTGC